MNTVLKIITVSCICWLIFMGLDFVVIASYALKFAPNSGIFPPLFLCSQVVICFVAIGIVSGSLACTLYFAAQFRSGLNKYHATILALAFSLALNCTMNVYILNPAAAQIRHSSVIVGHCILLIIFFFIFVKLASLSKKLKRAMFSYCLSVEFFWGIVRSLTKGVFNPGFEHNPILLYLTALCAGGLLFIIVHFIIPNIYGGLRRAVLAIAVVLLIFSSFVYGYGSAEKPSAHRGSRPNIVLIIIDTLRADHLSCYGYAKTTTAHIDQFARESILFKRAYATASWTLPSISSILTGTFSGRHGAHRINSQENLFCSNKLSDENTTLAEVLVQNGYQTASIVSAEFLSRRWGLNQGFQYLDDMIPNCWYMFPAFGALDFFNYSFPLKDYMWANGYFAHRVGEQINRATIAWMQNYNRQKPFFLFLHYFDPHDPYIPERLGISSEDMPTPIISKYGRGKTNYTDLEKSIISSVMENTKPLLHDEHDLLVKNYDVEIARTDLKIGEIFEALKKMSLYDNSIIVVVSDHGESFGEHNLMLHGVSLYEDNIHVPLIIKLPACDQKKGVVGKPVSLIGIMPTILSYLDIPIPKAVQGTDFFSVGEQKIIAQIFRDPTWKDINVYKRLDQDLISLNYGRYKLIKSIGGKSELYDLVNDPLETTNLFEKEKKITKNLFEQLGRHIKILGLLPDNTNRVRTDVDSGTINNLKALGYMQ